jgi:hypothetical protein
MRSILRTFTYDGICPINVWVAWEQAFIHGPRNSKRLPACLLLLKNAPLSHAYCHAHLSKTQNHNSATGGEIVVAVQIYRRRFLFASKNCENNQNTAGFRYPVSRS